jgi:quercetin dioxygenase-like cupin family protein
VNRPPNGDEARAALFALDALAPDQAAAFEERLRSAPGLRDQVDALRAVATEIGLAADPVAPRPEVRTRLLAQVEAEARKAPGPSLPIPDLLFTLAEHQSWIQVGRGIERRDLSRSSSGSAYLLRVAPGATIPQHAHRRIEHSYVLSGTVDVDGQLCGAGDYHRAAPGTVHRGPHSADGCVMLVVEGAA